ncbi:MAG: MMPL family transporter [Parvibaculaceae bacterium]|nr:MMPL family transporter [Parvibaculaceae bacterium]
MWVSSGVLRFPKVVIFVTVLASLILAVGVFRIGLSSDTRVYFSEDNQYLGTLRAFERKFSHNNNVLFVVTATQGSVLTAEGLAIVRELEQRAWKLPYSTQVQSITNFPHIANEPDEETGELVFTVRELLDPTKPLNDETARTLAEVARQDRLIQYRLLSQDERTTALNVNFNLPHEASKEVRAIRSAARLLAEQMRTEFPEVEIRLTGNVMLMGVFFEAARSDMFLLIPLTLVAAGIMLMIFLRSYAAVFAMLALVGLAAAAAMGVSTWFVRIINPSSVAAPVIIMTIAMASSIHVVIATMQNLTSGLPKREAVLGAVRGNFYAIGLTSLTTVIGFLSMNYADAPPFRYLGNVVSLGIAFNFILTFTLLPALLFLVPVRAGMAGSGAQMAKLGRLISKVRWLSLLVVLGGGAVASAGLAHIRLDDDFMRYFDDRFEYRRASDYTEKHLTGLNVIEFEVRANGDGGVYEPDYQNRLAKFADYLSAQNGVVSVIDISELTRRIHKTMLASDGETVSAGAPIPENGDLISQYFLVYEMSLPYGAEITDRINVSRSASRVTAIMRGLTSGKIRALKEQADDYLAINFPEAEQAGGISINVLFAYMSTVNIQQMLQSTIVSLLVISLLIALSLRSVGLGVLSFVTNLFPIAIGFGIWGYWFQGIGVSAAVITAMTIGIVVDDTIHFLVKYRAKRRSGLDPSESIQEVFRTVGVAMVVTTVSLVVGFSILSFSGFEVNWNLGVQAAVIISAALLVDWLLMPPILHLAEKTGLISFTASK